MQSHAAIGSSPFVAEQLASLIKLFHCQLVSSTSRRRILGFEDYEVDFAILYQKKRTIPLVNILVADILN